MVDLAKLSEHLTLEMRFKEALLSVGWEQADLDGDTEEGLRVSYFAEFYVDEFGWA